MGEIFNSDEIGDTETTDAPISNPLLLGKCPFCGDKIEEIYVQYQPRTCRVLCLGCKAMGEAFTMKEAYLAFDR